jgi:lipid-A-disaccharide synthase
MKKGIKESDILFIEKGTYSALFNSEAALVTSGTATLETALLKVPQVVCYYISCGWLISILRKLFLKVPYISLVNLVCGKEVVRELVANDMNVKNLQNELNKILVGGEKRESQLRNYEDLEKRMGKPGTPQKAAQEMVSILKNIS